MFRKGPWPEANVHKQHHGSLITLWILWFRIKAQWDNGRVWEALGALGSQMNCLLPSLASLGQAIAPCYQPLIPQALLGLLTPAALPLDSTINMHLEWWSGWTGERLMSTGISSSCGDWDMHGRIRVESVSCKYLQVHPVYVMWWFGRLLCPTPFKYQGMSLLSRFRSIGLPMSWS